MHNASEIVADALNLIHGGWRSRILHAGVELGVFDHVANDRFKPANTVAKEIRVDAQLLYRLMRALASLGLLVENESRSFATTETGDLFRSDHPDSLRHRILLTEGPEHSAIWNHLSDIVRDGKQDGFIREFGMPAFQYARAHQHYRSAFDLAMTSHSRVQSSWVLDALKNYDFSTIRTICDIGGGHGHLICTLLEKHPHLSGLVLDLPNVFKDPSQLWGVKLGLQDRCAYVSGDMFKQVPPADAYLLKLILHDWDDEECVEILANSCRTRGRVLIIEYIVPGPQEPHFAKLFDIHMMCWGSGRERTEEEYVQLLKAAGYRHYRTWYPSNRTIGIVEGRIAA